MLNFLVSVVYLMIKCCRLSCTQSEVMLLNKVIQILWTTDLKKYVHNFVKLLMSTFEV